MTEATFTVNVGTSTGGPGVISGVRAGDGPPLLLVHGGPGLSDYMSQLGAETAGWQAIRYQQRGLAPSLTDGPLTVGQHVSDAIAVLDELGLGQVTVLGHSWGAHLALQLAVAAPGRVSGLVLVDGLGVADPDGGAGVFGQGLLARLTPERAAQLGELGARIGERLPTDAESDEQLALLWPSYFADPAAAPPFSSDLHTSVRGNIEGTGSVVESLAGGFAARLAEITAPAVLVLGEGSPMPLAVGQQVAACLRRAEVITVPGAGHLPWIEQPGCIAGALATLAG